MLFFCTCVSLLAVIPQNTIHVVLEARYRTELSSDVTSTVKQIEKRMGQSFEKDDVLMQLDDRVYAANLDKAQAKVEETDGKLQVAKRLHADKVVSTAELTSGKAAHALALSDLAMAEKQFDACTLIAPYNGKVQQVFVQLYERVEPGQKLMEILDDSVLLARFYLPSSLLQEIHNNSLTFMIHELNESRTASVIHIAPAIDPASSLIKVEAEIDNADGALRSGMTGTLQLSTSDKTDG